MHGVAKKTSISELLDYVHWYDVCSTYECVRAYSLHTYLSKDTFINTFGNCTSSSFELYLHWHDRVKKFVSWGLQIVYRKINKHTAAVCYSQTHAHTSYWSHTTNIPTSTVLRHLRIPSELLWCVLFSNEYSRYITQHASQIQIEINNIASP